MCWWQTAIFKQTDYAGEKIPILLFDLLLFFGRAYGRANDLHFGGLFSAGLLT